MSWANQVMNGETGRGIVEKIPHVLRRGL